MVLQYQAGGSNLFADPFPSHSLQFSNNIVGKKTSKRVHCPNSFNADWVNGLTSTEPTFLLLESLILTVSQVILNASQQLFTPFLSALRKTFIYEPWDPEFVKIFSLSIQDLGGWLGRGRKRRSTSAITDWKDLFLARRSRVLFGLQVAPHYCATGQGPL